MIFIVAANHRHANICAENEGLSPRQWRYVSSADDLRGHSEGEVIFYETWHQHPDALEISQYVQMAERIGRLKSRNGR